MRTRQARSILRPVIKRYLDLKRALGRSYAIEERVLESIHRFLIASSPDCPELTRDAFANWCNSELHLSSGVRRMRMRIVRNFCLYRRRTEPRCFVPDQADFPPLHQAVQPYIFKPQEISRLLTASITLEATPNSPLRPHVFRLAIAILYTTG